MLLFDYSREWADFVVSQLIQRHGTRYTGIWSYSALVIGKEFENVLDKHWDEVHSILGPHLHFFALIAPPVEFVARAYKKAREQPPSEERDFLIDRYRRLLERQFPPKREQIQSKVILLRDLANAGLHVDQYADFLFFRFCNDDTGIINIDVVAAKHARIPPNSDVRVYLNAIQRMAVLAETHAKKDSSLEEYLRSLDWDWIIQLVFRNPSKVYNVIKQFASAACAGVQW